MKKVSILSDYTSADTPNILKIILDDQGDAHISIYEDRDNKSRGEKGVRIAASGSRHSPEFRKALRDFVEAYEKEIEQTKNEAIKELNS